MGGGACEETAGVAYGAAFVVSAGNLARTKSRTVTTETRLFRHRFAGPEGVVVTELHCVRRSGSNGGQQ